MSDEKLVEDCWNTIGSWGDQDSRCPKLETLGHCFNCSVYSGAGRMLLNRTSPEGYLEEWKTLLGDVIPEVDGEISSLLIFSVWGNYFAMPSKLLLKVTEFQALHRLPHKQHEAVLGISNIIGELTIAVSLLSLIKASSYETVDEGVRFKRNIVVKVGDNQWAIPVNEVYGIEKLNLNENKIISKGLKSDCVSLMFKWEKQIVNFIDEDKLLAALEEIRF